MSRNAILLIAMLTTLVGTPPSWAGVASQAAREAAEWIVKRFGSKAAREGVETLAKRIDNLAVKYGDEVFEAVRKTGPAGLKAIEDAGALGKTASRVLARYGDEGISVARKASRLRLVAEFGDEAAEALVRHGDIAASVIRRCGSEGAQAMARLSSRNARRLAMIIQGDPLWKTAREVGKQDELITVLRRWGDEAMDFIWRNKGSLAVAAVLITFLNNPEAYIEGILTLPKVAIETPTKELAERTNWTLVVSLVVVLGFLYFGWRHWLKHRRR